MDASIGITLSLHDFAAITNESGGDVSEKIREILEKMDVAEVEKHLNTKRTTCRIDLNLANKLQQVSDTFGAQPARVVRAAVEAYLHSERSTLDGR